MRFRFRHSFQQLLEYNYGSKTVVTRLGFQLEGIFFVEVKSVELSEDEVTIYRGPNRDPSILQNPDFLGRVVTLGVPQYEGDIVKYVLPSGETEAVIQVGRYTKLYIALLINTMCLWLLEILFGHHDLCEFKVPHIHGIV